MKKQTGLWLGAAVALCLFAGIPSYAAGGDIDVGGDLLFRVRASHAGLSVQERADKVYERLVTVIGDPLVRPEQIRVHKASPEYGLFMRDQLIFTIDRNSAQANHTTPYRLGQRWMKRLRSIVASWTPQGSGASPNASGQAATRTASSSAR